jgi:hypothetical protein
MSGIALFEGDARVPITVIPVSGKESYRALWVGIAILPHDTYSETYHLIVRIDGRVEWIESNGNDLVTDTKYDPILEDWIEPDR